MNMASKCKSILLFLMWTPLLTNSCPLIWAQDSGVAWQAAPDNTRTNERDRSKSEATADQQKENPSDQAITQQIRRAILQEKSLSTYAHNVKIVTRDGNVILKGPVRSIAEKRMVETKAIAIAGEDRVSSQLQIAPE
jgi:osmotically-inducible protein OsmY